ncbi:MAG: aspartate 1-decarboxylase [Cyclobacteriaceae bacterium]
MMRTLLKSKIHRAVVTGSDLNYEGSIAIDTDLCKAADLLQFEKVDIYNINNGARFSTYVIPGKQGEVSLNGAAARMVQPGDRIIIASYVTLTDEEAGKLTPKIVLVNESNAEHIGETKPAEVVR